MNTANVEGKEKEEINDPNNMDSYFVSCPLGKLIPLTDDEKMKEEIKWFKNKTHYFLAASDFIDQVPEKYKDAEREF